MASILATPGGAEAVASVAKDPEVNKTARNLQFYGFILLVLIILVFLIIFFTVPSCRTCSGAC